MVSGHNYYTYLYNVQNWIEGQKLQDKKFSYKHHQLSCTIDATTILIFVLCTTLDYLLVIYQYIEVIITNN